MKRLHNGVVLCVALTTVLAGCSSVGPLTLKTNRAEYNVALQESGNQQLLLNIVRLRYREPIMFLEVGSIAASHSASVGRTRTRTGPERLEQPGRRRSTGYSDSPTVSYSPLRAALRQSRPQRD